MKPFYLSKNERMIGGVCSGLGEYTNTDPLLWRIAAIFIPGTFWAYIFIWIFAKRNQN
jgi:phage shock protein PspC (stress-responsive transcriptional regulator)